MGKASKWFRSVFGLKKSESPSSPAPSTSTLHPGLASKPLKDKRQWSFVKSYRESGTTKSSDVHHTAFRVEAVPSSGHIDGVYPDKHVMTVAAAKAAVAEAAASAAQAAAAAAFRLTSSGWCPESFGTREEWAAIKIQAAFRGCLARRALRALKGLVKLQALVRGHIDRKRTAEWLHRVHAIVRVQACVRAGRVPILQTPFSNSKSSKADYNGPATPDKLEGPIRSKSMKFDHSSLFKRNASKSHLQIHGGNQDKCWDDDKSNRILEIDSGKQHFTPPKRRNLFPSINYPSVCDNHSQSFSSTKDSKSHQSGHSMSSYDEGVVDSPQLFSVSSRDNGLKNSSSPFAPSRSDNSRSYLSSYSDYPSYMAYTESSKAKVRSMSAPKQRPHQYERSSSSNRYSVQGLTTQRENTLHANFTSKAYPGSGRLDKFGMPVGYRF